MGEITNKIHTAYDRDKHVHKKESLLAFLLIIRECRKYGFPFYCSILDQGEDVALIWAAKLLIKVAETWPTEDIPDDFSLKKDTSLFNDASSLMDCALFG